MVAVFLVTQQMFGPMGHLMQTRCDILTSQQETAVSMLTGACLCGCAVSCFGIGTTLGIVLLRSNALSRTMRS